MTAGAATKPNRAVKPGKKLEAGDPVLCMYAVECDGYALKHMPEESRADVDIVLKAVTQNGMALEHAARHLRSNPAVVLKAVQQNGDALKFAGKELQEDLNIVLAAVTRSANAIRFAHPGFATDPGFVLKGVKKVSAVARVASPKLLEDRDFVRKMVYTNGLTLRYVPEHFKADREVVICAVFSNGYALEYAAPRLRADEEIALRAIASRGHAMRFVEPELRNTPEFVLQALLLNGYVMQHINDHLRADINDVLLKMVRPHGPTLPSVGVLSPAWQPFNDPKYGGEGLEGMDGFWRVNNNTIVEIKDMEILIADGRREKVLKRGSDWLHAVIEGKLCKGQVYDGNWMDWDDGDVWLREYVLVEALARHWECHMPEKPGFRAVPNPFKKEIEAKAKAKPRLLAATPNPEVYDLGGGDVDVTQLYAKQGAAEAAWAKAEVAQKLPSLN